MPIYVKPNLNSDVRFEFSKRSLVRRLSNQIKKYETDKDSVDLVIGVRKLRALLKSVNAVDEDTENFIVSQEHVPWFLQNKLIQNGRFLAIYCPACKRWYSPEEARTVSWRAPKPKGFSRGGGRGKYFACPHEHIVYHITRKIS